MIGVVITAFAIGVFSGYGLSQYVQGIEQERDTAIRVLDEWRRRGGKR